MIDNSRALAATVTGAVMGGIAGYLFFTPEGRALRRQIEPALEDLARELDSCRRTIHKVASVANEGWKLFNDTLGDGGQQQPARYAHPHQTSPF